MVCFDCRQWNEKDIKDPLARAFSLFVHYGYLREGQFFHTRSKIRRPAGLPPETVTARLKTKPLRRTPSTNMEHAARRTTLRQHGQHASRRGKWCYQLMSLILLTSKNECQLPGSRGEAAVTVVLPYKKRMKTVAPPRRRKN